MENQNAPLLIRPSRTPKTNPLFVPSLYLLWAQNLAILPSNLAHLRQNEPD